MPAHLFAKDPDDLLDYQVDWSDWLGEDTIASAAWTVPAGLTKGAESNTATAATVWLSGGAVGQRYQVTCRITTAVGRTRDQSIFIRVVQR